jgi:glycolate oxidase
LILFDERNADELARVHRAAREILQICADVGGTISGEHGIGIEKLKEMSFIFSESDIDLMRQIKRAFDPEGIWNPGKVVPPSASAGHPTGPYS